MDILLGKSRQYDRNDVTLLRHTEDVLEAAEALFGTTARPTRLGHCWKRFFRLEPETWQKFHMNLVAACATHDWGKANDGMQGVLARKPGAKQAIRHEHFSALLLGLPAVMKWLEGNPQLDVPLVLSAVLTHHLKAAENVLKVNGFAAAVDGNFFHSLDQHDDFRSLIDLATTRSLLKEQFPASALPSNSRWAFKGPGFDLRTHRDWLKSSVLKKFDRALSADDQRRRLLLAVRAGLIAADAAGSGLVREGYTVAEWFREHFDSQPSMTGKEIWEKIIERRIVDLEQRGKWHDRGDGKKGWNDFQIACDTLPERALLLAPCGSGKTLAAWRWIAAHAVPPVGRVLFLYPTRATAKEGFKDYVAWAPEADAALMHGTAAFDLDTLFDNGDDPRDGNNYETDRKLFSLGYWPRRIFSATVDQFLAFLAHSYGPVCMLPVLADSIIVIDEVHSFDRNMFSHLKDFLRNFTVPVLCMTATLPQDRRDALIECGLTPPPNRPEDLERIAQQPRYRLTRLSSRDEAVSCVRTALAKGKRVLWVVNTVDRCHAVVRQFAAFDSLKSNTCLRARVGENEVPVFCYHSRFKLIHRVSRHQEVVNNLKISCPAGLGVTTQVCEMSLDLDVDVLVTEACPVTSLIQRMGRCNRDRQARLLYLSGDVLVYQPESDLPYDANDLKGVTQFLDRLAGRDLSQADLEAGLNDPSLPCPDWLGDTIPMFLKSGPYAAAPRGDDEDAQGFREGKDFNRPCVLKEDVARYLNSTPQEKPGYVLPLPRGQLLPREENQADYDCLRFLGVASHEHYHPLLGFCKEKPKEWSVK